MDVESAVNSQDSDNNKKSNGHSGGQINGVSNGYSGDSKQKSSHKDKKDRDRDRDRDKKDNKSSRDKDRDKHSSSKDKDRSKDHKSSSKDKDRDRDKDRDKDRDRDRDRDKDKERDRDRDKEKSDKDRDRSDRDKDKHKNDKDRHHDDKKSSSKDHKSSSHSSSRDKDKDKDKDRSKDHKSSSSHDKDKDKDKERDRHKHSSSSKDKDKDRHGSSRDKDKSKSSSSTSKDKDKDKDKEKDKDKHHSSSSSKDKEKDIERNKDRKDRHDRERDERSDKRDKTKSDKSKSSSTANEIIRIQEITEDIKEDPFANIEQDPLAIKDDPDSQDYFENTRNNMSAASSCDYSLSQFKDEPIVKREDTSHMNGDGDYSDEQDQEFQIKEEYSHSDDDMPLASRASTPTKRKYEESDEDDDLPLVARKKPKKEKKDKKPKKRAAQDFDEEDEYDEKPKKAKIKKEIKQESSFNDSSSPKKRKKKEEAEPEVWKWWEEEKKNDGTKWTFLEHKGPVFAPPYEPLPDNVKFYYDGQEMKLSQDAEEVAGFYARMLDHDYTSKDVFNNNFFKDWRKCMTEKEKSKIKDLKKCNFKQMQTYFLELSERNRNRTKEEKEELKRKNQELLEEYGFCTIDGHKEKIGNFKIEPPGLFRGRGEHPKMGMLKRRVMPEDVSINCSKDSNIPKPPPGHKWKDVRHDPGVTWLASWTENVQNQVKYVMLNPSSKLKGEKDWQKYETARRLAKSIDKIRTEYREDWKSKEMRTRQRAVALYFIDKLALRAGNEKDEDQADTVGCCSLRVEHIQLVEKKDGKDYVVVFDFLGKDSIRYYNEVPVEKRVFKNLQLFIENKSGSDDLFDRLTTSDLNKHLNELMEGLTAKVFRTYNASWTLQQQLEHLTNPDDSVAEKILSYNRANRAVAILCNHQRSVPKGHEKSMEKLKEKIEQKRDQIAEAERQVKDAKRSAKGGSVKETVVYDKKKKMLERLREQLKKLEVQETDRDENKTIALGTSKLNYLDPRISVAWCKKFDVPIEKIYNKTQRDKFRWAIDMADADYVF